MTDLVRPLQHPSLRAYLNDVVDWHGYIRFLGLPTFQEKTDVGIGELFVAPALSAQRISPDALPDAWPSTESLLEALGRDKRLVLLGDPGSGKSTLVNWMAWRLSAGLSDRLPDWIDNLLPLPLVLRELDLSQVESFDDLIEAFLKRPVAAALRKEALNTYLERGQVLLLLDGIDEVAIDARRRLRQAVWQGWQSHPLMCCVATSRLVGYEECAFDVKVGDKIDSEKDDSKKSVALPSPLRPGALWLAVFAQRGERRAALAHVAPFDDRRIEAFASNWYRARIAAQRQAQEETAKFIEALRRGNGTWRLARTPNLLTIMALVYRVKVKLPDGRGLLYESIAQAYLESIDQSRGFEGPYPWQEKRRWLARVGFEMQYLRSKAEIIFFEDEALLASEAKLLGWIGSAMQESSYASSREFAQDYLQWIARRSGLLLPRGESRYAFLHLSFQEYFAAVYLLDQIQGPDWASLPDQGTKRPSVGIDGRVSKSSLRNWANLSIWRESFVFAFELLGQQPRWADKLAEWVYGPKLRGAKEKVGYPRGAGAVLLARLLVNPHSGLSSALREQAWSHCWSRVVAAGWLRNDGRLFDGFAEQVLAVLCGSDIWRQRVIDEVAHSGVERLNLSGSGISDIAPWVIAAPGLKSLGLFGCPISDLAPLRKLSRLSQLSLDADEMADLSVCPKLQRLTSLDLRGLSTRRNMEFLIRCRGLRMLTLWDGELHSLEGIGELHQLRALMLGGMPIKDLAPLASLGNLESLTLADLGEIDVAPLARLPTLKTVRLHMRQAKNVHLLRENKQLEVQEFN